MERTHIFPYMLPMPNRPKKRCHLTFVNIGWKNKKIFNEVNMSVQYNKFLKLLEKWPVDKTKVGR